MPSYLAIVSYKNNASFARIISEAITSLDAADQATTDIPDDKVPTFADVVVVNFATLAVTSHRIDLIQRRLHIEFSEDLRRADESQQFWMDMLAVTGWVVALVGAVIIAATKY